MDIRPDLLAGGMAWTAGCLPSVPPESLLLPRR
jgi:hypothetical protein